MAKTNTPSQGKAATKVASASKPAAKASAKAPAKAAKASTAASGAPAHVQPLDLKLAYKVADMATYP